MKPHQIISLMTFGGADNTFAMGDHDDHIHVGWRPLYGQNRAGGQADRRRPEAGPVDQADRPPRRHRQPDRAHEALALRDQGPPPQRLARAPRRVASPPPRSSSSRRASHSAPGVSVSPCATIEQNTTSAARLKIRSPSSSPRPRTSSENVIVATPFGPNQAMKPFVAVSTRLPTSAIQIAIGRASRSVNATIPTAAQPSAEQAVERQQRAEDDEDPELDDLDDVLRAAARTCARGRAAGCPSVIAHTKTAMKPLPAGSSTVDPVGRERHAERRTATCGGAGCPRPAARPRGISHDAT